MAQYDERGREIPDNTPVEIPLGWRRPLTLQEQIQRHIRVEFSQLASSRGFESFEEADDFDVDEDPDMLTQYELHEMAPEAIDRDASPPADKAVKGAPPAGSRSAGSPGAGAVPTADDSSGAGSPGTAAPAA